MAQDKTVVGNIVRSTLPKMQRKQLLSIFVVVSVLTIALLMWHPWHHLNNPYHVKLANLTPQQQAQYLGDVGEYKAAEQVWEKQLVTTKDASAKLAIYYQQSALATRTGHYDDAKKYAEKGLNLSPNSSIPHVALAELAQAQNDKTTAKKEWQQAIDHLDKGKPEYSLILRDYQASLEALK